jgi:hypothetical protein
MFVREVAGEQPVRASSAEADYFGVTDTVDPYELFCAAVALRQLSLWLPAAPALVLDLSRPLPGPAPTAWDERVNDVVISAGHHALVVGRDPHDIEFGPHKYPVIIGDARSLGWVRSQSVDAVIVEGGALSECLAAEDTMADIARILRPGGRVLASATSLTSGLSRLAEQHRWPELADAPAADVMLVPDPEKEGSYLRCFGPDELRELVTEAGLEVEWVRWRTVLPAAAVRKTLASNPRALGELVANEMGLADAHEGESHGSGLVVSGRKRK